MFIDAHAHAFPNYNLAAGYDDPKRWMLRQQGEISRLWGRMVSSTLDKKYMPDPYEDVGFRLGKYGRYYWTKHGKECWFQRFPTVMVELEWPPENTVAFMDSIGVDKAILQAGYMKIDYCREYFVDCMKKFPGRFIGTVAIDYDIKKSEKHREGELDKLRYSVNHLDMRGVFQGFPREQRTIMDDDRFDPLWKEMGILEIPHIFVLGLSSEPKRQYLESIDRLEKVLKKFPNLNIIIGHLGGNIRPPHDPNYTDTPKDLMKILKLPNVYFEVGYVLAYENWDVWKENYEYPYPLHTKVIKRIYDEVGAERLLWGSDIPNIFRTCSYRQCLDLVRLHFDFLREEEKNLVLGGNAAKLFRV